MQSEKKINRNNVNQFNIKGCSSPKHKGNKDAIVYEILLMLSEYKANIKFSKS